MTDYTCDRCGYTTAGSTYCHNLVCPNLPCCGNPKDECKCNTPDKVQARSSTINQIREVLNKIKVTDAWSFRTAMHEVSSIVTLNCTRELNYQLDDLVLENAMDQEIQRKDSGYWMKYIEGTNSVNFDFCGDEYLITVERLCAGLNALNNKERSARIMIDSEKSRAQIIIEGGPWKQSEFLELYRPYKLK